MYMNFTSRDNEDRERKRTMKKQDRDHCVKCGRLASVWWTKGQWCEQHAPKGA